MGFALSTSTAANGEITIRLTAQGTGAHGYPLRTDNIRVASASRTVTLREGAPTTVEWKARRIRADTPWSAVVVEDGDVARRREVYGP